MACTVSAVLLPLPFPLHLCKTWVFLVLFSCYCYAVLKDTTGGILHLGFLVIDIWTWPLSHI